MSVLIDKKTLEYLAELGRIELTESEKPKLLKDLQEILDYFQELKKLDTTNVEPTRLSSPTAQAVGGQVTGSIGEKNIFREDVVKRNENTEKLTGSFPEKENNFLKIPPVFQ